MTDSCDLVFDEDIINAIQNEVGGENEDDVEVKGTFQVLVN